MAKRTRRWYWGGLGGAAAFLACHGSASAAPTVAQILAFAPRQAGVECSTPAADHQASCKVSLVKAKKGSGWLLADAAGTPLRRFFDSNDDNKIDTWSYYLDGQEIYRENDTNFNSKPDQYRWLNTAGTRIGTDANEDGRIDSWKSITREEVGQEALQAVSTGDFARLQALLLTEAEMKALELAPAEAQKVRDSLKQAQAKFDEAATRLKGKTKVVWLHFESGLPQSRPADAVGSRFDLVRQPRCTVLFEASGKSDWLQTGELVKVGEAWRLIDGPLLGAATTIVEQTPAPMNAVSGNPTLQKLLEELSELDKISPPTGSASANPEVVKYNLHRADVLEKITAEVPAKDREPWVRQVADSLSTALQNSGADDRAAGERMAKLEKQIVEAVPKSNLAAYVAYRYLQADYSARLVRDKADYSKEQKDWMERLTQFVATYPKTDDTPDALLQLGMTCEFLGKESEAKKWYAELGKQFGDKAQAVKGRGAVKRLELDGKDLQLAGPTLVGGTFDLAKLKDKVVVVYYWASWNQQCKDDFTKLKQLGETHGSKGMEVVCVNLDGSAEEATSFVKKQGVPWPQVQQPGGLDSPLATDYGIMVLPNLFLVGKDGKVVNRNLQVGNLEEELKKLLK